MLLTSSVGQAENYYWESMTTVCHYDDFDTTNGYIDEITGEDSIYETINELLSSDEQQEFFETGYVYL